MWRRRAITGVVVVALVAGFVLGLNQPWLEQWGSTPAEPVERFPGAETLFADPGLASWRVRQLEPEHAIKHV